MLWAVSVSYVVNFRLEIVIIPRCFRFRSSCPCRVYVDYYFFAGLGRVLCLLVHMRIAIVAIRAIIAAGYIM